MKIKELTKKYAGLLILLLALALIYLGIIREEDHIVLRKSINICLECIGIG